MQKESTPSYYAIVPANVRYNNSIPDGAKLLYGEITALSNQRGYCFATNARFAKLYNKSTRTIQNWIKALVKENYIYVDISYIGEDDSQRKIYLRGENNFIPSMKKTSYPHENNCTHNNTSNNKENNNTVHSQKNELFETSSKYHFDKLWDRYAHKVNKQAAEKAYKRLSKKQIMEAVDGLARYEAILEVTKVSKCHVSTYLNGKRWLDEMPANLPQSSNFNAKGKSEEQLKAHITSESFKKHSKWQDLYKKAQSIAPTHLKADKAKIDNWCLRYLDKYGVGVEEGVNRFDELIKNK